MSQYVLPRFVYSKKYKVIAGVKMKSFTKQINFISLVIILLAPLFSGSVWAGGGHGWGHGGGGHFGGWHGGGHFGYDLALGLGLGYGLGYYGYGMPYPYPYYPYQPVVAAPSPPPVYTQQNIPTTSEPQTNYWHYCRNPDGYYPYVRECPGGWEKIPPQPVAQ